MTRGLRLRTPEGEVVIREAEANDPIFMANLVLAQSQRVLESDLPVRKKAELVLLSLPIILPHASEAALELMKELHTQWPNKELEGRIAVLEERLEFLRLHSRVPATAFPRP